MHGLPEMTPAGRHSRPKGLPIKKTMEGSGAAWWPLLPNTTNPVPLSSKNIPSITIGRRRSAFIYSSEGHFLVCFPMNHRDKLNYINRNRKLGPKKKCINISSNIKEIITALIELS